MRRIRKKQRLNLRNRGPVSDLRVRCKYEQRGEPEVSGEQCADIERE